MHSRATDRRSASKCQGKWPGQTLDQAFGLPEVLVAVSTSRLSCKRAGKARTLMPVWDSSGESRLKAICLFKGARDVCPQKLGILSARCSACRAMSKASCSAKRLAKWNNGREGIFALNLKEFRHAATSIRPDRGPHRDRAENPPRCGSPCHACHLHGAGARPP